MESSSEESILEINFKNGNKVKSGQVEAEPKSSKYQISHPFISTNPPEIIQQSDSTNTNNSDSSSTPGSSNLDLARKIKGYSRYFLPHTDSNQHVCQMEDPYYYFHGSPREQPLLNNQSPNPSKASIPSTVLFTHENSNTGSRTESSTSSSSLKEKSKKAMEYKFFEEEIFPLTGNINLNDFVMNEEEIKNIDLEFEKEPKPFESKWDYINPLIYFRNYNCGQFLAVIIIFVVIIFGSLGFLISTAKKAYSPIPPEVIEILSPYRYPTLGAIRTNLVDPDTPNEFRWKNGFGEEGERWKLVFSDEFNAEGRTFYDGDDQFFEAVDLHYQATQDLEYYVPFMARTRNGTLQLTLDAFKLNGLNYISSMLQSWNKLCFNKNAIVEVSLRMPSYSQARGLWPAVWSLGNLARPGYMASTDGLWPYTYNECDYGITPNQSTPDGLSFLSGQRLSKCTCYGEDHPNIGTGRGAPEIDIIEGTRGLYDDWALGAQTLQVAPFDPWWRPDYSYLSIENNNLTSMKPDTGTPFQEAIASTTVLNNSWFEELRNVSNLEQHIPGDRHFQRYGFEYRSGKTKDRDSYVQFFMADNKTFGIKGDALHPTDNVGWRDISKEPMSLVFNLGLSPTWMNIDFGSLSYPATLEIDYIRIYQPEGEEEMTCNPPDYPTTDYINKHINAYSNSNLTSWNEAGYKYPRNSFMHGCQAPSA